jgi:predicted acylesterase/phospholipase RssA
MSKTLTCWACIGAFILTFTGTPAAAEQHETIRVERIEPDGVLTYMPSWRAPSAPHWGAALSGGAALGLAHLGVLRGFEEDGLTPDLIAGTSAGALIGGMYASGTPTEVIERVFREKNWNAIFRETPRTQGISTEIDPLDSLVALGEWGEGADGEPLPWRGLVNDWQIFREFVRYYGRAGSSIKRDLDRFPIPFRAVACDLKAGEVYAPRYTHLETIVRASIGLPILRPVRLEGRVLVDGGALENVPVPTARSMGADFVVAVHFAGMHELDVSSFLKVIDGSYKVAFGAQRRPAVESADAAVPVDTTGLEGTDFHGKIDELITAGYEAWQNSREHVISSLENFDYAMKWYEVRSITAGEGATDGVVEDLSERLSLDGTPKRISRLRLELALISKLLTGEYQDGWWSLLPDGRIRLSLLPTPRVEQLSLEVPVVFEPAFAPLRSADLHDLTPAAVLDRIDHSLMEVRREGYFMAGISEFSWEPSTGTLQVRIDPGTFAEILLTDVEKEPLRLPRPLRKLQGQPANIVTLERALVRLDTLNLLWREGSSIAPMEGGYRLRLAVTDPPIWLATWNGGLADELGLNLMGRLARPSVYGQRRWGAELRMGFNKEIWGIGAEVSPEWDHRLLPFFRLGFARPGLRIFDEDGQTQEWRYFYTAIASAGYRSRPTTFGQFELGPKLRWTSRHGFYPEPQESSTTDLSLELLWHGDLRDDPRAPRKGFAWAIGGALPVAGDDRPWLLYADFSATFRLARRYRLGFHGRIAETESGEPLPADRWGEVGTWWEAPGFDPGRSRAREFRRLTVDFRRDLGEMFGLNVSAGVSGAVWKIGEERVDPMLEDTGMGGSIFVQASTARLGPITVGFGISDVEGLAGIERVFILFSPERISWTGPIRPREGAILR